MREQRRNSRPLAILGVPLKPLLVVITLLLLLFVVVDPYDIKDLISDFSASSSKTSNTPGVDRDIVATPEMISQAKEELREAKIRELETTENISPTDRFYYIIELKTGGDLEADDVVIEPDTVTITSSKGVTTTIPRTSVQEIKRFKLPPSGPTQ